MIFAFCIITPHIHLFTRLRSHVSIPTVEESALSFFR